MRASETKYRRRICVVALVVSVGLCVCQSERVQRPADEEIDASGKEEVLGVLEGVVTLSGEDIPEPTRIENTTDPELCGRRHTLEDLVVSADNRGVRNVILALADVPPEKVPLLEAKDLVLDNVDCRFVPHASVLTVGSTVEAVNSDPILHTTHFYGAVERNIALPVKGVRIKRRVDAAGMIVIKCDVHGWMQAFIRVDAHPYHAVSDASGWFRIGNIPPGSYTLEAWHEKLGSQEITVRIEGGETEHMEVDYALPSK